MSKRIIKIAFFALSCCLAVSACTNRNATVEEWKKNEFFGLDLDKSDQVGEFHELLSFGKLDWHGTKLEEWDDGWGSDYDLSEGKVSTTRLFNGSAQEARSLFIHLDSIFFDRYNNREPLKQKRWIEHDDGIFTMTYLNFFDYKGYRIGLTLIVESTEEDENKASAGSVLVGLGTFSLPK